MNNFAVKQKKINKCPLFVPIESLLPKIYYSQQIRTLLPFKLTSREGQYISLHNKRLGYFSPYASERTWNSGLKNGHTDTEVFSLVNGFNKVAAYTKRGTRINEYVPAGNADAIVLDMDNSVFSSPDQLIEYLKNNNMPLPRIISQTSPCGYHLVYRFQLDAGEKCVTREDSLYLGLMLSKVSFNQRESGNTAKDNINGLDNTYFKIDKNYINQDPSGHKFRVPSSPKIKESPKGREVYICRGWVNRQPTRISQLQLRTIAGCYEFYGPLHRPELHWHDGSYIDGLEDVMFQEPKVLSRLPKPKSDVDYVEVSGSELLSVPEKQSKAISDGFWKAHVMDFQQEIEKVLPKRYAKRYADWLSQNLTFLKNGQCAISQTRLGEELDITQATISKHLKILVDSGILWTNHQYSQKKIPKYYRLGQLMINRIYTIDTTYEIGKEYGAGTTNDQFMGDIRYLHSAGLEKQEIVTLLDIKMQNKPKSHRRRMSEIEKAVDRWAENCEYKKPPFALIDFDEINRNIIGVQYNEQVLRFTNRNRVRTEGI